MNIVKLKDKVMPDECSFAEFFNKKLKGKFAYWVQMRYIFPLDSLDYITYIRYEQLDNDDFTKSDILPHIDLYSEECCMYEFAQEFIDCDTTSEANTERINDYRISNEYVTDFDIDINNLRVFRSWLANEILVLNTSVNDTYIHNLTENQVHMLKFYKNDMYNDIVKQLSIFGLDKTPINSTVSSCGCCNTNISGLYNNILSDNICNALDIYIKNIHNLMVSTFEDVNFWLSFDKRFIKLFKKYIDNIIKTGLIVNQQNNNIYIKCNCNNNDNSYNILLSNLSESLQYIIDNNINGHMNFIHDSLYNWAEYLYDKMFWKNT